MRRRSWGRCGAVVLAAGVLAGCGGGGTSGTRPAGETAARPTATNPYDIDDPGRLAEAEVALARGGGSCEELTLWYDANPGDSNVDIARHYLEQCLSAPPPVRNGELSLADVTGSPPTPSVPPVAPTTSARPLPPSPTPPAPPPAPATPACATEADVAVSAVLVGVRPTDDGLDGRWYVVETTVTNTGASGATVIGSLEIRDGAGTWLDYETLSVSVDAGSSATVASYEKVTYDGVPVAAVPVALVPGSPVLDVHPERPCR